jgi:hypothetical protein
VTQRPTEIPRTPIDAPLPDAEWRVVYGWPNYEVSDYGNVRRAVPASGTAVGLILRPNMRKGYLSYRLYSHQNGTHVSAHVLVCAAFHGPRPSTKHEVAHWDGARTNCWKGNLRWATGLKNAADRERHGRTARGAANGFARLTEAAVAMIKGNIRNGRHGVLTMLAREHAVSLSTIHDIKVGRTWKHVA